MITAIEAGTLPDAWAAEIAAAAAGQRRPRARHHRHRRVGQVVAHRRADPALPPRPGGQAPHRGHRRRPDPAQGRRRAARRPHPHERHRLAAGVLPLAGHPVVGGRGARVAARRDRRLPGRRASTSSSSRRRASARATPPSSPLVDVSLYVMTPEFGAASQLEKIDMLDFADAVAINKFERRGAEDALRDVRRQLARNREDFATPPDELPVFGTIAARFNDDGVTALYQHLLGLLAGRGLPIVAGRLAQVDEPRAQRGVGDRAAGPGALPGRDRGHGPRLPRGRPSSRRPRPAAVSRWSRCARPRVAERLDSPELDAALGVARRSRPTTGSTADSRHAARRLAGSRSRPTPRPSATASRCRARSCLGSRCPGSPTTASCCAGCGRRTCPARSRSPPACSRSSARARTRPGCSPARAARPAPTAGSTCWPRASPPPACPPRSTRSRSTASTPTSAPTSTARSATRACPSPPSTT